MQNRMVIHYMLVVIGSPPGHFVGYAVTLVICRSGNDIDHYWLKAVGLRAVIVSDAILYQK